ncbi:MaoC family dehydratase [Natranaeroarchaeum sulfidigenes]|uniref:Acyl dehydratase n=1 Tax=Natranaeroarchaeum sulfidigenes TaxID=2784880 RepID=A0A897MMQ6_9EURY|nr:MaoC/PaaZ C-terminal domain-containing protein [Natranaeroarchaeum sulfidigenes]QSG01894.1 Acyl dehydratase [Natranaeroarchaeum sulfidigenes]
MSEDTGATSPLADLTSAWVQLGESAVKSATAMNRAAMGASVTNGEHSEENGDELPTGDDELRSGSIPSLAFEDEDWSFERSVERADAITVGDRVSFSKPVDDEDVKRFAVASGDTNRLHIDDEFAEDSRFGGRIAHGTLVSGLISAALARLPGLTIYLSQDLEFRGPVRIGDRVTATVEVIEALGNDQYRLSTIVSDDEGETIIDGEAVVLIDDLPAE